MSLDLRIILDKSVIHGLSNQEIDSLDRYFFQIIPPILLNEILAGLTKERGENRISNAAHRVSGNGGLAFNYREILGNSLIGNEVPMDGRFLPAGEKMVRSSSGSIGTVIDTTKEQEAIFRWERKNFQESEKTWASAWRRHYERPINSKMYVDEVLKASLVFETPKNDSGLAKCVDLILNDKKFQGEILVLLAKEFKMPLDFQKKVINRWFKEGKPMIKDFAPYAYFCSKANFLWAIGLTNSSLFNHDKNDRKDLEYSYYIPFCQIFASKDKKHKRLIPFLLRPDQSFVDGDLLKTDLRQLSENWSKLSQQERISYHQKRDSAPPENESSIVFQLWRRHRGVVSPSFPLDIINMEIVNSTLPKEKQNRRTFGEFIREKYKELNDSVTISTAEKDGLRQEYGESNPSTFLIRKTKISKERILNLFPHVKIKDIENINDEN